MINYEIREFDIYKKKLIDEKDKLKKIQDLKYVYKFAKDVITDKNFTYIRKKILECQSILKQDYIFDVDSNFKYDFYYINEKLIRNINTFTTEKEILDYIVSLARSRIYNNYYNNEKQFDNIELSNLCRKISILIKDICKNMGIICYIIKIDPGYDKNLDLYYGSGYHYFNVVKIENKKYIVDCTYKQFFKLGNNLLEKLGIFGMSGPLPGVYMSLDEKSKLLSLKLIKDGYVILNNDTYKRYLDGFTLSFRNGYYYDLTGNIDFNTNYSVYDYNNFIFNDDNQSKHENILGLGIQKRFLKEKLDFKTDIKGFK